VKLYTGTVEQFNRDVLTNQMPDKLQKAYETYYYRMANPREVQSWTNSLQFMKNAVEYTSLKEDMIVVEYELPYSNQRIDCMLFGRGPGGGDNVVLMELKQWSKAEECDVENNVVTFVGGANRMEAHPSYQVGGYHMYLKDFVEAFEEPPPLSLSSACYCHNYPRSDAVLFDDRFAKILSEFPLFAREDLGSLADYLKARLAGGGGKPILDRFSSSRIAPSKKLLAHARNMIEGQHVFNLLEEQIAAYNTILDRAKKSAKLAKKSVIIVRGGPGTGKSAIALNVIAELLSRGIAVYHATGSASFTTTLRRVVGQRASPLFKYFNSFSTYGEDQIGVLVCDEAHRIRRTSNSRYTRTEARSDVPQVDELLRAAKVTIFFIDDHQVVRPEEIGSAELIREAAKRFTDEVFEFELKAQFRCGGSDGYLNWVDDVLGIRETANRLLTKDEKMEFKMFGSPQELHKEIERKNSESPNSARMVAGFCWPWSDPNGDGTLVDDVVIGEYRRPWNAKADLGRLAPGIPRSNLWAYDPKGVEQIGCIYTIQGFEFDYVGVIFGRDLTWDDWSKAWVGDPSQSYDSVVKRDREQFLRNVKNTYRVLLTRGMKGCYVCFLDKGTEDYFRSRVEVTGT
jgi:uncharacterized protein